VPDGTGRFAYANNNPVKYVDPSGHYTCSDIYCHGGPSIRFRYGKGGPVSGGVRKDDGGVSIKTSDPYNLKYSLVGNFQMLPATFAYFYGDEANNSYSGYYGGGDSDIPLSPLVSGMEFQSISVYGANVITVINDALLGIKPAYDKKYTPYSQSVYAAYLVQYQNIPRIDAKSIELTGIRLINSSESVVNYTVTVGNGKNNIITGLISVAPGTNNSVDISLPPTNVTSPIRITAYAFTGCTGPCYQSPNPQLYAGYLSTIFLP